MSASKERLWTSDFIKLNISNFMNFFAFYLLMPLLPIYLNETFGAGKHETGVVLSGYTLMALLVRPFAGYVVDSFDRKKVLVLVYAFFFLMFGGYIVAGSIVAFAIVRTVHGIPFGAVTVANSTAAIDSLNSSRRAEGIGYYGLSNNLAMATAPTIALYLHNLTDSFMVLFGSALAIAGVGLMFCSSIHPRERAPMSDRHISTDRFFLMEAWREAIVMACLSFSFGIISTYIAIYSVQHLEGRGDSGMFFLLASVGLMLSRLVGGRSLGRGRALENAQWGMILSLFGYTLFAASDSIFAFYSSGLIVGLGNGHMFPAMQTMFINLAENNRRGTATATQLTAWDTGIGLGIVVGGIVSELIGYRTAFSVGAIVNAVGVVYFWIVCRGHYRAKRLR